MNMCRLLNLVVLRVSDLDRAESFYSKLGLVFTRHRHGSGPEHLSAESAGLVFELYPVARDGKTSSATRIGFRVPSIDAVLEAFSASPDAVIQPAADSEWGRRAVIVDPDGHRIELLQA
jgi:predicted enzyme related to lactoylglutathione lyase